MIDGDTATSMAYVDGFHRRVGSWEPLHVWGRWVDQLTKVGGQWLFRRREVHVVGRYVPGDREYDNDRPQVSHPGRLTR